MTNLQSTVTRSFVFTELFGAFYQTDILNSYFKILVESHYEGNDDQFAKYCQTPRNHRFQEVFCCWSSVRHFGALTVKLVPNAKWPIYQILSLASKSFDCGPEHGQFVKHWHTFVNHRDQLTLWCLPSERHFEAVTVKLSLNAITTKKIADFQNSVTRLLIIVFT